MSTEGIEIPRPPEEVFAYLVGLNDAQWRSGVSEVRTTSETHAGVGATRVEVWRVLGRRIETPAEVVAHEPSRRWSFRRASGRVRPQVTYTLEPLPTGTRLTMSVAAPGRRARGALVRPLLSVLGRASRNDLARLRERLQREGASPEPAQRPTASEAREMPARAAHGRRDRSRAARRRSETPFPQAAPRERRPTP